MIDLVFYSIVEVLTGFAPNYTTFMILRALFGIGMGGEWGVGASLAMEKVPVRLRGGLPGFAYQCGVLLSSSVVWIEATFAQRTSYGMAMALTAVTLFAGAVLMTALGRERNGAAFGTSGGVSDHDRVRTRLVRAFSLYSNVVRTSAFTAVHTKHSQVHNAP